MRYKEAGGGTEEEHVERLRRRRPKRWYVRRGEKEIGPLSSAGLRRLASRGELLPEDEVRTTRMREWRRAVEVKGLVFGGEGGEVENDAVAEEVQVFLSALYARQPRTWVLYVIVALNVCMYAVELMWEKSLAPSWDTFLALGGNAAWRTPAGEWWRLVASMFLHASLVHIAFNMWVLWDVGGVVERLLGSWRFAVLYLGSGILGGVATLVWNAESLSVGASGAVFGVYGALVWYVWWGKCGEIRLPRGMVRMMGRNSLIFIAVNLLLGLLIPQIDNAAHVGGLVGGFVVGILVGWGRGGEPVRDRGFALAGTVTTCLLVVGGCVLVGVGGVGVDVNAVLATVDELGDETRCFLEKIREKATEDLTAAEMKGIVEVYEKDLIPRWSRTRNILAGMIWGKRTGREGKKIVHGIWKTLLLQEMGMRFMAGGIRGKDPAMVERGKEYLLEAWVMKRSAAGDMGE